MKRYLLIPLVVILALSILVVPGLALLGNSATSNPDSGLKAAIIDQLYDFEPNPAFIEEVTAMLEVYGFQVDVWRTDEITLGFYKELPRYGYNLIIFRAHSGIVYSMDESKIVPKGKTYLFTGETYTTTRYVPEQLTGRVQIGYMAEEHPTVFAVNSEFVAENLKGSFDNTAIIMMGCSGYYLDDMASAFIQKGARVYLGWSASVTLDYVDGATLNLISKLFTEELTVEQAVSSTMAEVGRDPYYNARLKYFPAQNGSQSIREIIQ